MTGGFQCLQIENHDFPRAAVRDVSAAKIVERNNSVAPFQTGNGAHHGAAVGVEHFDLCAMRKVNLPRGSIERNIVKILEVTRCRTEGDLLQQVVTRRSGPENVRAGHQGAQTKNNKKNTRTFHGNLLYGSFTK